MRLFNVFFSSSVILNFFDARANWCRLFAVDIFIMIFNVALLGHWTFFRPHSQKYWKCYSITLCLPVCDFFTANPQKIIKNANEVSPKYSNDRSTHFSLVYFSDRRCYIYFKAKPGACVSFHNAFLDRRARSVVMDLKTIIIINLQ